MRGMDNPILKIARPRYNADTASNNDLSFSSETETPKIFMQTSSNTDLSFLGYVPSFMGFRQLSSTSPTEASSTFDSGDYTFSVSSTIENPDNSGVTIVNFGGSSSTPYLYVGGYSGSGWSDTGGMAILFFDPLSNDAPADLSLGKKPSIILAKAGENVDAHPSKLNVDSRFDTFKIYKTGTLDVNLPSETILTGNKTSRTEIVSHNLGYPPAYLPEVGVDWDFRTSYIQISSSYTLPNPFVVNDHLGERVWFSAAEGQHLDVWVDSNNFNMRVTRLEGTYTALTVRMYYTIFYNDISEEFNLLE